MYDLSTRQVSNVSGGLLEALGITGVAEGMAAFGELSALGAVFGAGYGVGTLINHYLPGSVKRSIGDFEGGFVSAL